MAHDDPRGFTVTGGLPFYGQFVSSHALTHTHTRARARTHTHRERERERERGRERERE